MIVTFPTGPRDLQLYDAGGVPVVWQPGVGVVQDPNAGGTNAYRWPDVLQDAEGRWYQIGQDWAIRPFAGPPPAPARPAAAAPPAPAGGGAAAPAEGTNPAAATGATLGVTVGRLTDQLGKTYDIAGLKLPLVAWIGLPAAFLLLRRRSPARRASSGSSLSAYRSPYREYL